MTSDEDILRAAKKDSRVTDWLEAEVLKKRIAELEKEVDDLKYVNDRLYKQIENMQNTRTQSQWISDQLAPALNKCFKSKIGCDGMLMVAVDDYNELVDLINKAASPKKQGQ